MVVDPACQAQKLLQLQERLTRSQWRGKKRPVLVCWHGLVGILEIWDTENFFPLIFVFFFPDSYCTVYKSLDLRVLLFAG